MAIDFACGCGKQLKARDELAGRRTKCPACGEVLTIPAVETPAESAEDAAYALLEQEPKPRPAAEPPVFRPNYVEDDNAAEPEPSEPSRFRPARPAVQTSWKPDEPVATSGSILEYSYLLLIFALIPLVISLLGKDKHETIKDRIAATMEKATDEEQARAESMLKGKEQITIEDLLAAMPGGKLAGAHLSRDSVMHWVYAAIATVAFLLFILLFFSVERANPLHLLGVGLFTGTLGIVFLLVVQWCSQLRFGRIRGRGIFILILLALAFIGWSYRSALDADSDFFLSAVGFTFGVGLCEEATKAIPLLFFFKRDAAMGWRAAMVWGLASGIGFGVSEGVMYAGDSYNGISGPDIYLVRFISCVALHAMWSGMVAISIARNVEWYESVEELGGFVLFLLRVLAVPMVLHGFYDTLLKKDMNVGALVVALASFAWLVIQIEMARGAAPEAGTGRRRRMAY